MPRTLLFALLTAVAMPAAVLSTAGAGIHAAPDAGGGESVVASIEGSRFTAPASRASDIADRLDATLLADPAWQAGGNATLVAVVQAAGATALDEYLAGQHIVGDTSPVAVAAREAAFRSLADRQAPLRGAIEQAGVEIVDTYDAVANGFLVVATRAQLERIAAEPDVLAIYRAPMHYPLLDKAVPTIGADRVIDGLGFDGTGVNVAIIDTGIDYTHRSFGGAGTVTAFRNNNPVTIEPGSFPTDKVIGGYDFAGTRYTGGNIPMADDDPLDEARHGTHVAGIAAGMKGNPAVPHGVAPEARLIALKVFGRAGGTNLANSAIEWCVEANLGRRVAGVGQRCDVINMSLGSSWANGVTEALGVVKRATEAGVVVVASAGNSGDVAYITGSPAASPHAISVASTFAGGQRTDKVQVDHSGRTEDISAAEADPRFAPQMAELGLLEAPLVWLGRACTGDASEGDVAGAIALIAYGGCTSKEVIDRAGAEGAVGALLYNFREQLFVIGSDADEGDFGATVELPAYAVALGDGERLRDMLIGGTSVVARFSESFKNSLAADSLGDVISPFSSRGPSRRGELKPDVAAPGSNILAPAMGGGTQAVSLSGTSMAGPIVAGVAALIVDRMRDAGLVPDNAPLQPASSPHNLGALDVAAMLVNYTETVWQDNNRSGRPVPLARAGSGRIDALRAVRGNTVLRTEVIASINFGRAAFASDSREFVQSFTIRNLAPEPKRYKIDVEFLHADDREAGVSHDLTLREVELPAHENQVVTLRTTATAADLKPFGAYGGGNVMNRLGGLNDAEFDAHVVVREVGVDGAPVGGGDVARLPVYLLPRATASVEPQRNPVIVSPETGEGPVTFDNPSQARGIAELFALLAEDVDSAPPPGPMLNIEHVGARVVKDGTGQRMVEFAIQTQSPRQLPLESTFRVYLDTDLDGRMDRMLFNHDLFYFLSGGRTAEGAQRMLSMDITRDSPLQLRNTVFTYSALPSVEFAEVTLDSRLIILRMYASVLGYGAAEPVAFDAVVAHHPVFPEVIGSTRNAPLDVVPNGGYGTVEGGGLGIGAERLTFDERRIAFGLDRWRVDIDREDSNFAVVSRRPVEGAAHDRILAVFTQNLPGRGDFEVLSLADGEVEVPPTHTPDPTDEPTPSATPFTLPPIGTPTAGPPTSRIHLPAALKSSGFGAD